MSKTRIYLEAEMLLLANTKLELAYEKINDVNNSSNAYSYSKLLTDSMHKIEKAQEIIQTQLNNKIKEWKKVQ